MSTVSGQRIMRGKNGSGRATLIKPASDLKTTERILRTLLDEVQEDLISPGVEPSRIEGAIDRLFRGLRELRLASSPEQWNRLIRVGRAHQLRQLVHQDPFTSRAFYKPRGYAGDALMMDYIYGREEDWSPPPASDLGAAIYRYTTDAPASAGVRERRCYIVEMLDELGRIRDDACVLSIASGHLREAGLSLAMRRNRFARFVAIDADAESLEEIRQRYGKHNIETVAANVRRMLTGRLDLGSFDCIYSTGLYDYLADSTARRLTANLFDCLRPQGRLVIANFLPAVRDVGYMEMFMDWHLVYRTRSQMMALADDIAQSHVSEIRLVAECNENVVIMEMTKR